MIDKIEAFGICLRKVSLDDLKLIAHWRNDKRVLPFMDDTRPVNEKILSVWFNKISQADSKDYCYLAQKEDTPFSYVEITNVDFEKSEATAGSFFDPDMINSGLFVNNFLCRELALKELGINTLITKVRKTNKKSCHIQEALGGFVQAEDDDFFYFKLEKDARIKALKTLATMLGFDNNQLEVLD